MSSSGVYWYTFFFPSFFRYGGGELEGGCKRFTWCTSPVVSLSGFVRKQTVRFFFFFFFCNDLCACLQFPPSLSATPNNIPGFDNLECLCALRLPEMFFCTINFTFFFLEVWCAQRGTIILFVKGEKRGAVNASR